MRRFCADRTITPVTGMLVERRALCGLLTSTFRPGSGADRRLSGQVVLNSWATVHRDRGGRTAQTRTHSSLHSPARTCASSRCCPFPVGVCDRRIQSCGSSCTLVSQRAMPFSIFFSRLNCTSLLLHTGRTQVQKIFCLLWSRAQEGRKKILALFTRHLCVAEHYSGEEAFVSATFIRAAKRGSVWRVMPAGERFVRSRQESHALYNARRVTYKRFGVLVQFAYRL